MPTFRFNDERDWFLRARLGLFIHWGLYAVNGIHEQEQQRFDVPADEYARLAERFNPRRFDPYAWVDAAMDNGFEYLVLTTKHHDGFCLWPSRETTFHVGNTPFKRDILGELAAACHRRGLPLEWYYSVVDWHQENYPNIGRHHEIVTDPAGHDGDRYLAFLRRQIAELCTDYGKIHGIWWDMNVPEYKAHDIHEAIRRMQPAAVINNRGFAPGDYSTPERDYDPENANSAAADAEARPIEACQSVGVNSWGYRADEDYYSLGYFLRRIDQYLAAGGNYLLNVGPDADGEIPPPAMAILDGVGAWMRKVRPAFDGTPVPGLLENRHLLVTRSGKAYYVHVPLGLDSETLSLRPLAFAPRRATLLNTGEEVAWTLEPTVYERNRPPCLRLRKLPADRLQGTVPVFRIEE